MPTFHSFLTCLPYDPHPTCACVLFCTCSLAADNLPHPLLAYCIYSSEPSHPATLSLLSLPPLFSGTLAHFPTLPPPHSLVSITLSSLCHLPVPCAFCLLKAPAHYSTTLLPPAPPPRNLSSGIHYHYDVVDEQSFTAPDGPLHTQRRVCARTYYACTRDTLPDNHSCYGRCRRLPSLWARARMPPAYTHAFVLSPRRWSLAPRTVALFCVAQRCTACCIPILHTRCGVNANTKLIRTGVRLRGLGGGSVTHTTRTLPYVNTFCAYYLLLLARAYARTRRCAIPHCYTRWRAADSRHTAVLEYNPAVVGSHFPFLTFYYCLRITSGVRPRAVPHTTPLLRARCLRCTHTDLVACSLC